MSSILERFESKKKRRTVALSFSLSQKKKGAGESQVLQAQLQGSMLWERWCAGNGPWTAGDHDL